LTKGLHDFLAATEKTTFDCRVFTQVDTPNEVFDTYGRLVGDIEIAMSNSPSESEPLAGRTGLGLPDILFVHDQRGNYCNRHPCKGGTVQEAWRLEISKQDGRDLRLYLARAQEE
jgi:hypothetical protein